MKYLVVIEYAKETPLIFPCSTLEEAKSKYEAERLDVDGVIQTRVSLQELNKHGFYYNDVLSSDKEGGEKK